MAAPGNRSGKARPVFQSVVEATAGLDPRYATAHGKLPLNTTEVKKTDLTKALELSYYELKIGDFRQVPGGNDRNFAIQCKSVRVNSHTTEGEVAKIQVTRIQNDSFVNEEIPEHSPPVQILMRHSREELGRILSENDQYASGDKIALVQRIITRQKIGCLPRCRCSGMFHDFDLQVEGFRCGGRYNQVGIGDRHRSTPRFRKLAILSNPVLQHPTASSWGLITPNRMTWAVIRVVDDAPTIIGSRCELDI